jgi:hypothetical protein
VRARRPLALRPVARAATAEGARLRAYFLTAALASAAVLSVAAAAVGPLPESLAGAVGVLALSLILYFSLAPSPHTVRAGLWLLPLTVSFVLQPGGRRPWDLYPTEADIYEAAPPGARSGTRWAPARMDACSRSSATGRATRRGTSPTRTGRGSRAAAPPTATTRWSRCARAPPWAGWASGARSRTRSSARSRRGWRCSACAGCRCRPPRWPPRASGSPAIPWTSAWSPGRRRFFPLPMAPATEIQVVSLLSDAVGVAQGQEVARVEARLATGRSFELSLRAGVDTAEWSWERADVRPRVAHQLAPVFNTWTDPGDELRRAPLPGAAAPARPLLRRRREPGGAAGHGPAHALPPGRLRRADRRPHAGVAPGRLRERRRRARGARGHAPRPPVRGPGGRAGLGGGADARPSRRRGGRPRAGHCRRRSASIPPRGVGHRRRRARPEAGRAVALRAGPRCSCPRTRAVSTSARKGPASSW